ncbi:MAG TPA: hypothetical protein ENN84_04395 [Candidatus Marinimicrobia bacterium]|nr:hypothetical protein [Candidatus Neomarinimicrobiota bacterium]
MKKLLLLLVTMLMSLAVYGGTFEAGFDYELLAKKLFNQEKISLEQAKQFSQRVLEKEDGLPLVEEWLMSDGANWHVMFRYYNTYNEQSLLISKEYREADSTGWKKRRLAQYSYNESAQIVY